MLRFTIGLIGGMAAAAGTLAQGIDLAAVSVIDASGERAALAELVDGPTILHFWATWCGPCRQELPAIEAFAAELAQRDLAEKLVLVSVDTSAFDRVEDWLADLGIGLETVMQVEGNAGSALAILGYPSTLIVDGNAVLMRHQGALKWTDEGVAAELTSLVDPISGR